MLGQFEHPKFSAAYWLMRVVGVNRPGGHGDFVLGPRARDSAAVIVCVRMPHGWGVPVGGGRRGAYHVVEIRE